MRRKRILIPGYSLGDNSFGIGKSYANFISQFGIPIILTPDHNEVQDGDLLLLPGGADIAPDRYGVPGYYTGNSNPMLEYFDRIMLPQYINAGISVFATCRGAQSLYSIYGGKLNQHVDWHTQSDANHNLVHELEFTDKYKTNKAFSGQDRLIVGVNSRHHQTMDASREEYVPEELEVIAYAKEGKGKDAFVSKSIVEIFRHRSKLIVGCQFHVEDMIGQEFFSKPVINAMLNKKDFFADL